MFYVIGALAIAGVIGTGAGILICSISRGENALFPSSLFSRLWSWNIRCF